MPKFTFTKKQTFWSRFCCKSFLQIKNKSHFDNSHCAMYSIIVTHSAECHSADCQSTESSSFPLALQSHRCHKVSFYLSPLHLESFSPYYLFLPFTIKDDIWECSGSIRLMRLFHPINSLVVDRNLWLILWSKIW